MHKYAIIKPLIEQYLGVLPTMNSRQHPISLATPIMNNFQNNNTIESKQMILQEINNQLEELNSTRRQLQKNINSRRNRSNETGVSLRQELESYLRNTESKYQSLINKRRSILNSLNSSINENWVMVKPNLKGGSQFIHIPNYGKRKVRYQKNGRAYVIVNKKKLKLN